MTTLREARDSGKLAQFIKEREAATGDGAALEKTIRSMAGKSSEALRASGRRKSAG